MISLHKIVENVSKCKIDKVKLPSLDPKFSQKTAYQFKLEKLKLLQKNIELNQSDIGQYNQNILNNEISKLNENTNKTESDNLDFLNEEIKSESLIIINEYASSDIPETIINLFKQYNNKQTIVNQKTKLLDLELYYIYGLKNPDSFYKSILLLTNPNFIIKNRNDKKNYVNTFKKELALQFDHYYKKNNYKSLRIVKSNLTQNLLDTDNYFNYDILVYLADYCKINITIIDVINNKYDYIDYLIDEDKDSNNDNNDNNENVIIIKYANDTFLPILNSSGIHKFSKEFNKIIFNNFELINHNKFNRRQISEQSTEQSTEEQSTGKSIEQNTEQSAEQNTEQLKPISKYTLKELQDLANDKNIDIKKQGKKGLINKTKNELFNDISNLI